MLYLEPLNEFTNDRIIGILYDHGLMEEAITPSWRDEKGQDHRILKISEEDFKLIENYKKSSSFSANICFNIFKLIRGKYQKIVK
jgi:hypothetical protein